MNPISRHVFFFICKQQPPLSSKILNLLPLRSQTTIIMQFTLKFALLALASVMAGVQVIASPVADPVADPKPQDLNAQYW
jgi:hypothetical protein